MTRRSSYLIAILALALLTRCWAVHYYGATPSADADEYHRLAVSIASGDGFAENGHPTSFLPPLYPAFLASVYLLAGPDWKTAEYANALLGVLTVWLIFRLAQQKFGDTVATTSAFIAAIFPSFIWISRVLLTENLALPLILATLLWFPRWWSGALLGLTLLCRPSTIFLVALLFTSLVLSHHFVKLLKIAGVLLLTLIPWTARNYLVQKSFVPIAADGGVTLYFSYWPVTVNGKTVWGNNGKIDLPGTEAEQSGAYSRLVRQRLVKDPLLPLRLAPVKIFWLLAPVDWNYFPKPRSINWGYILIAIPALIGALRSRDLVLWSVPIAILIQTLIFFGASRYRLPLEPIMVIWAALTITRWHARFRSQSVQNGAIQRSLAIAK